MNTDAAILLLLAEKQAEIIALREQIAALEAAQGKSVETTP